MRSRYLTKFLLIIGFLSIGVGTLSATRTPPADYELSIYAGTPIIFWAGFIAALCVTIWLLMTGSNLKTSLSLGTLLFGTLFYLPSLRGYFFYGEEDPMTHLGWVKDILNNKLPLSEFLYPGLHLEASLISLLTNSPPRSGLLLAAGLFPLVWIIFLPITIREIVGTEKSLAVGFLSAAFLLPLNPFNVFLRPHPTSHMIFYSPVLIFLFFKHRSDQRPVAVLIILLVSFFGMLITHVQQAVNIILLFLTIVAANRLLLHQREISRNRFGLEFVVVAGVSVLTWLLSMERVRLALSALVIRILRGSAGTSISSKTGSISELGIDLEIFVLKLAAPYLLTGPIILLGIFLAILVYRRSTSLPARYSSTLLFTATIPVYVVIFCFFLVGGNSNQWGRYIGFMMVPATVLLAISLLSIERFLSISRGEGIYKGIVFVIICLIFLASVPGVYPSPYYQKPNVQVTEKSYSGYETGFEYRSENTKFFEIRSPVWRYRDAIYGRAKQPDIPTNSSNNRYSRVPDHFADQRLESYLETDYYLVVTEADYRRDRDLYNGFRYNAADFNYLDGSEHIYTVYDSGGANIHYISTT